MNYKKHNEKLISSLGISESSEEGGITYWYVSGGKCFATLDTEKVTYKDILNRYGAARFEEGQDNIKGEFKFLLGLE